MESEIKNNMKIIGFCSRKSGGKTLCSSMLQKYGYIPLNFADELKELVCHILNIPIEELEIYKNNHEMKFNIKNKLSYIADYLEEKTFINRYTIIFELQDFIHTQRNIREFLQFIGTDLIRKYNPNWHISSLLSKIDKNKNYCIGDVRFLNEKKAIEDLGGKCFFIIRPQKINYDDISNHTSEIDLDWTMFDNRILINDSTIDNLILYGKNPENEKHYKKSKLFININYKSAYLAGYLFLNDKKFIKNPFILENYKLWKCSNKSTPDILLNLHEDHTNYYKKIWLKGIWDYLTLH